MSRILLVDDEKSIRLTSAAFLEQAGHSVVAVPDAGAAEAALSGTVWDVVVIDLLLGASSGLDVARKVRAQGANTQIVIMTGEPDVESARESIHLGVFDYLMKPVPKDLIIETISRAAVEKGRRDAYDRLQESNRARLVEAQQVARLGWWEYSIGEDCIAWSDELYEMYGITHSEDPLRLERLMSLIDPAYHDYHKRQVDLLLQSGEAEFEYPIARPDGKTRWIWARGRLGRDRDGKPERMFGVTLDITERKLIEKRLQLTLDATADGIWYWHFASGTMTFSSRYYTMLGYEPDEFPASYETWVDLIHPADRARALAVADAWLESCADTYENEFRLRTRDGNYLWIHARARVVERDEDGGPVLMIGNHQDITNRKCVENELARERDSARAYLDLAPVIMLALDREGCITLLNEAGARLLGCEVEDAIGRNWFDSFLPETVRKSVRLYFARLMAGELEGLSHFENAVVSVQREERIISWRNTLLHDDEGRIAGTLSSGRDVTDEREAAVRERRHVEELNAGKALLDKAEDIAGMGSFRWDMRDDSLTWSKNMYSIHGVPEDTPVETLSRAILDVIHEEDREKVQATIQDMVRNRAVVPMSFRVVRRDGSIRRIESNGKFVFDESGEPIMCVGVHHDVTERRQLEARVRRTDRLEAVGRLCAGISYEYNNILMGISGYAHHLLKHVEAGSEAAKFARDIQELSARATTVSRQLLDFSRAETGNRERCELDAIVRDEMGALCNMIGENIDVAVDAGSDAVVDVDRNQIVEVLLNMFLNANDAMPEGVGTVRLETAIADLTTDRLEELGLAAGGEYARISIRDTGAGMSEATLESAFEPFFSTKELDKGTGLGLSSARGIVRAHGGAMELHSTEGKGTAVDIYLPACGGQRSSCGKAVQNDK